MLEISPNDTRKYLGIIMENGLKVVLIHDETVDMAAAAMNVQVGHQV